MFRNLEIKGPTAEKAGDMGEIVAVIAVMTTIAETAGRSRLRQHAPNVAHDVKCHSSRMGESRCSAVIATETAVKGIADGHEAKIEEALDSITIEAAEMFRMSCDASTASSMKF